MITMLKGNGKFQFDIVGESRSQAELQHLAGPKTEKGVKFRCMALLMLEDHNPHDANAVKVGVIELKANRTLAVGYLSRANAKKFRAEIISACIDRSSRLICEAMIVGGWDRPAWDSDEDWDENGDWIGNDDARDVGAYGVKLDLVFPLAFNTVETRDGPEELVSSNGGLPQDGLMSPAGGQSIDQAVPHHQAEAEPQQAGPSRSVLGRAFSVVTKFLDRS